MLKGTVYLTSTCRSKLGNSWFGVWKNKKVLRPIFCESLVQKWNKQNTIAIRSWSTTHLSECSRTWSHEFTLTYFDEKMAERKSSSDKKPTRLSSGNLFQSLSPLKFLWNFQKAIAPNLELCASLFRVQMTHFCVESFCLLRSSSDELEGVVNESKGSFLMHSKSPLIGP